MIQYVPGPISLIVRRGDAPGGVETIGGKRSLRRLEFLLLGVTSRDHEVIPVGCQISVSKCEIRLTRSAADFPRVVEIGLDFEYPW